MKKKISYSLTNEELLRWHSDVFATKELGEKIYYDIRTNCKSSIHPFCGWRSVPNQNLDTLSINRHGLRSPDFDTSTNKKDVCVVLGGSVAWGYGATKNDFTPAYLIKKYLKQNGFDYEVVCLAQCSHNSHDELRSFISSVDELNPRLVIDISGLNDIWQIAKRGYNKAQLLHTTANDFLNWGQSLGIIHHDKKKIRTILQIVLSFFIKSKAAIFLEHDFYQFGYQSDLPIKLFSHKLDVINAYCELKNIKIVHVLQPHLFFKKNQSQTEKEYIDYWCEEKTDKITNYDNFKKYLTKLRDSFFSSATSKNVTYINGLNFFDEYKESIFFDIAHVSDKGNDIMSKKIVEKVISQDI